MGTINDDVGSNEPNKKPLAGSRDPAKGYHNQAVSPRSD